MLICRPSELWVLACPKPRGRGRWHAVFVLSANGVPQPQDVAAVGRDEPESFNA
jgi:hypothetical protein